MKTLLPVREKYLLFSKFIHYPNQIGSVFPSSKALAHKIVTSVPWEEVDSIAELGAGTGAVTWYIRDACHIDTKVWLFEKEPSFLKKLKYQYPKYYCYEDACELNAATRIQGVQNLDCVISGLPFTNFSQHVQEELLEQIKSVLKPGGLFIIVQFSRKLRKQLEQKFYITDIHFVIRNFPPSFVFVCRKRI